MTNQPDNNSIDPEQWVDEHGDYLYSYALSRLRNEAAAQDVVQETFLAALNARDDFRGEASIRTWLVRILHHKIVDHLRKLFREQPTDSADTLPAEEEHVFRRKGEWYGHWIPDRSPLDWGLDPERTVQQEEFWEYFNRCLGQLPPRLAVAFTLAVMEEMASPDICKELSITSSNLWVMLHRARRQLRRCLEIHWLGGKQWPRENEEDE